MRKIQNFIFQARLFILGESLLRWLLICAGSLLLCMITWSLLDYLFLLRLFYRQMFYPVAGIIALYCAGRWIVENRKYYRPEEVIYHTQRNIPPLKDTLINAWQLHFRKPEGVSEDLIEQQIHETENSISEFSAAAVFRFKKRIRTPLAAWSVLVILFFLFLYVPPGVLKTPAQRVLYSLSVSDWGRWYTISPGTQNRAHADSVSIEVTEKQPLKGMPILYVRPAGNTWRSIALTRETDNGPYRYMLKSLTTAIEYFVLWNDWESPVFTLTPVMMPHLGTFTLTYTYPAYTGLPPHEVKDNPHVSALAGTTINFFARANKELAKAVLIKDGKEYTSVTVNKDTVRTRFTALMPGFYAFKLQSADGMTDPEPPRYDIRITQDKPPFIELISPNQDLIVAADVELPLIIQALDDFGLEKIELHYKVGEAENSVVIAGFKEKTYQQTFEYVWKLSRLRLGAQDTVYYYLKAWDSDAVHSPKSSVTRTQRIEITNYQKEHDAIEADLHYIKDDLLHILADQTQARENLENIATRFSTAAYNSLLQEQSAISQSIERPIRRLESLLSRMENDPYTDFSTYNEYHALASHLKHMQKSPMPNAVNSLQKKQWEAAKKSQDEIMAGLEKMSLLAEDIWQYQKMRDLIDASSSLKKESADILDQLAHSPKPEELKKTLSRIGELLQQIGEQMNSFPKELPEDFINAPAVKNIDLRSSQSALDALSQAIDKGDWEKAMQLARGLQENLSQVLKTLDEAGKDVGFSENATEKLYTQVNDFSQKVSALAQKQGKLNNDMEKQDRARRETLFALQEDLLKRLAKKQKELLLIAQSLQPAVMPYYARYPETLKLMHMVYTEFEQKRVYHSQKYLQDAITGLEAVENRLPVAPEDKTPGSALRRTIVPVIAGEKEILRLLKEPVEEGLFSDGDKKKMNSLSLQEKAVASETKDVRHALEEFFRQSASLPPQIFENMYYAQQEMEQAGGMLEKHQPASALESGHKALDYLLSSQNALEQTGESLAGQKQQAGKSVGSPIQMRQAGGMVGFKSAPVKLPGIQEYKPPREFRQEILEALKEKYPQRYEKIIKEYYKKLTE